MNKGWLQRPECCSGSDLVHVGWGGSWEGICPCYQRFIEAITQRRSTAGRRKRWAARFSSTPKHELCSWAIQT